MQIFDGDQPSRIMIHHSLTRDSGTVSWSAIEAYHKEENGWIDIGYHAGLEMMEDSVGRRDWQALYGRPWTYQGAHCKGEMNRRALAVCCVGNYDEQHVPDELLDHLVYRILKPWSALFEIPLDRKHLVFHREFSEKTCPGENFRKDLILDRL